MLNYSLHRSEAEERLFDSELIASGDLTNPFPGLRPFGVDESHLFFGREGQVDEILLKLSKNRFIALLGYSGSGKSSLMHCGVIPVLYGGFMTEVGPNWNIVISRPGGGPIDNLAEALVNHVIPKDGEEGHSIRHNVTAALLKTGSTGLVDVARRYKATTGENLLILIDQFEELFRYAEYGHDNKSEASQFVSLLVDAIEQEEVPIHVAITMRSDFIGDSAQYARLTKHINRSSFVIPLMSRHQKRMAIEGPVAVGGGRISERLVNKLLEEIGDNQDQLPIMQHALMRTWDYWVNNRESGEAMDIRHYNAIGKISDALSLHADEAYDELTDKGKRIAEVLFKSLTEIGDDNFGIRRRSSVKEISSIAGVSHTEVIEIVEHFRKPGRSLLMPALPIELDSESVLEISHESLMRIWTRLRIWVEEENDSAKMYKRISEAAEMHQIGRSGLWRPPDLQLALNWQKKQSPTRQWAERYNTAFERAIVFLDTSKVSYEADQKSLELKQKRDLQRAKTMALVLGVAAIIAIFMFVWAIVQQIEATTQSEKARIEAQKSKEAEQKAKDALKGEEEQRKIAENSLDQNEKLTERLKIQIIQVRKANEAVVASAKLAEEARAEAVKERDVSIKEKNRADSLLTIAINKTSEANSLLHLTVAQSMTTKSLQEADGDLKGLLAEQAYQFNSAYGGYEYDKYIYDGLYYAMANFMGPDYNTFLGSGGAARSLSFGTGNNFYSVGSDGKIYQWNVANEQAGFVNVGERHNYPLRDVEVSNDAKWLAVASDSSNIELYSLSNLNGGPTLIGGHKGLVYEIRFLPDSRLVSLGFDGVLSIYNPSTNKTEYSKKIGVNARAFDVNADGTQVLIGTNNGQLIQLDLVTNQEKLLYTIPSHSQIHAVKVSKGGTQIAFGGEDALIYLWSNVTQSVVRRLKGPTSRINSIEFSHDGKLLAAASFDNSIHMWNMNALDEFPIVMKDNFGAYAWDIAFSNKDEYLVVGTNNGKIKKWPVHAKQMADEICKHIKRNMTLDEWERFVGNNIEYRNTCVSLLLEPNSK
ncbi:MAG: hypothetical protein KDC79_14360 [Cyclobacteriaceae bacterium]|nr:hypothetical protein [Cyclobacteriaceae bacterium]